MAFRWSRKTDDQLLDMPLSKLPIQIKGTWLEDGVHRLHEELEARGIQFKPHCWLAEDWFSPDGVPGIAIPFFLAHERLRKLEQRFMMEVEGGSEKSFMRILRHETGHTMDTAYRLHFRRRWRELFGSYAQPYPDSYRPRPNSRQFVLHLRAWYAQAHPAEDFAETFAVWLTPGSNWRRRYRDWPVLRKLEYVDEVMKELAGQPSLVRKRRHVEPLSESRITLRAYYERKREQYSLEWPAFYDRDLRRIFSEDPRHARCRSAAMFLRLERRELCQAVSEGTGVHPYTIHHILEHMSERCKALKLRMGTTDREVRQRMLILLTMETMNVVHSGYFRLAL